MWLKNCSPAFRRYYARALVAMAVYLAVVLDADWAFAHHAIGGALRYVVAAAPAAPLIAVIASMGLFLREETDEFQRGKMVEQILWGTGATLAVASVWGFLETFGLARHFEAYWLVILWFAMFGGARGVVAWRYR